MSKVYAVGIGPGSPEQMTQLARRVLEKSDVIAGYMVYADLVRDTFPEKEFLTTPMRREEERCRLALERAQQGKEVAVICSGDAGVYGMAGLLYELSKEYPGVEIEVVPGVTAATAGAALLGAPLMHDFAVISLSDALTPWEQIEKRLRAALSSEMILCLYNPESKKRPGYLRKACEIALEQLSPETVCGLARRIGREGESCQVMSLAELAGTPADMFTTVFIGNRTTKEIGGKMVTPRGYQLRRKEDTMFQKEDVVLQKEEAMYQKEEAAHRKVLLFGGTTEGRLLASYLAKNHIPADICVATAYGREILPETENARILQGRLDAEEIRGLLQREAYTLVLDATHPFAQEVSENIRTACHGEQIRYCRVLRTEPGRPEGGAEQWRPEGGTEQRRPEGGTEQRRPEVGPEREMAEARQCCGGPVSFPADSAKQAVQMLCREAGPVFLTTGSKSLPLFMQIPDARRRVFARILPAPDMLQQALALGLPASHITCAQGPFSAESNLAAIDSVRRRWKQDNPGREEEPLFLVTKDSGQAGGFPEKCRAAKEAGVRMIVIRRPQEAAGSRECLSLQQAIAVLDQLSDPVHKERAGGPEETGALPVLAQRKPPAGLPESAKSSECGAKREIYLIGCGMNSAQLTLEADAAIRRSDLLTGAARLLEMTAHYKKPSFCSYHYGEITEYLIKNPQFHTIAALFSGDIGLCSGAAKLREYLAPYRDDFRIIPLSGISSPVHFLNTIGKRYEDVRMLSLHGQTTPVAAQLRTQGKVLVLLGKESDVPDLCRSLLRQEMENVQLTVGSCLYTPQESIVSGSPAELLGRTFPALSVAYLEYPDAAGKSISHGLPDTAFSRSKVPMTKAEVRSIILSRLGLTRRAVFYDIGAGTGSIAIEAARLIPEGQVFAIERREDAVSLIRENAERLCAEQVEIVAGTAPEAFAELVPPTHAFIGGSGGRIKEILKALLEKNPQVRIVLSAVTLETLQEARNAWEELCQTCRAGEAGREETAEPTGRIRQPGENDPGSPAREEDRIAGENEPEIIQVQVSRAKKKGRYHMMQAENPVFILCLNRSPGEG